MISPLVPVDTLTTALDSSVVEGGVSGSLDLLEIARLVQVILVLASVIFAWMAIRESRKSQQRQAAHDYYRRAVSDPVFDYLDSLAQEVRHIVRDGSAEISRMRHEGVAINEVDEVANKTTKMVQVDCVIKYRDKIVDCVESRQDEDLREFVRKSLEGLEDELVKELNQLVGAAGEADIDSTLRTYLRKIKTRIEKSDPIFNK